MKRQPNLLDRVTWKALKRNGTVVAIYSHLIRVRFDDGGYTVVFDPHELDFLD